MSRLIKILTYIPYRLILSPLIKRNYRLRERSAKNGDGKYPDKMYWADQLAMECGYLGYYEDEQYSYKSYHDRVVVDSLKQPDIFKRNAP